MTQHLRPGEVYAGLLLGENGAPDAHLFLLPGDVSGVTWDAAKAWAVKAGGELPTRREQRILFANAKLCFQAAWYWSGEQHADGSDFAWGQNFGNGDQYYDHKSYAGHARAVRRLAI
ncbi:hypothetical protein [Marmoricola sp. RAF53]